MAQNNTTTDGASDGSDIAAGLALFLLDQTGSIFGRWEGRIPAATQRRYFGVVLVGRKTVEIDGAAETVMRRWSVCFGTDSDSCTRTWAELEKGAGWPEDGYSYGPDGCKAAWYRASHG